MINAHSEGQLRKRLPYVEVKNVEARVSITTVKIKKCVKGLVQCTTYSQLYAFKQLRSMSSCERLMVTLAADTCYWYLENDFKTFLLCYSS